MKTVKRVLGSAVLIVVISTVYTASGSQKIEPNWPSAKDLLARFAENQNNIQSYIVKSESLTKASPGPQFINNPKTTRNKFIEELRFDGHRVNVRQQFWLDEDMDEGFNLLGTANRKYTSYLWDGKQSVSYSTSDKPRSRTPGSAFVNKTNENTAQSKFLSPSGFRGYLGYCLIGNGTERIDSYLLSKAKTLSVRDKTEIVGGAECYVIDGVSENGKYTLWIDPQHGYNIAKTAINNRKGDIVVGKKLESPFFSTYEVTRFEKVDNVWVPVEGSMKQDRTYPKGNENWTTSFRATEIVLNPDFDALHSFEPNDIPNGTLVMIPHITGVQFTWQDGKVIDKYGTVFMDCNLKK